MEDDGDSCAVGNAVGAAAIGSPHVRHGHGNLQQVVFVAAKVNVHAIGRYRLSSNTIEGVVGHYAGTEIDPAQHQGSLDHKTEVVLQRDDDLVSWLQAALVGVGGLVISITNLVRSGSAGDYEVEPEPGGVPWVIGENAPGQVGHLGSVGSDGVGGGNQAVTSYVRNAG